MRCSGLIRLLALATVVDLAALAGHDAARTQELFTVNAAYDAVDASPGDGVCADAGGACTLRAAVMETNALPGRDEISLPAGNYVLAIPGTNEDAAATGDLDVTDQLTIVGAGATSSIVDGARLDRVLHLDPERDPIPHPYSTPSGDRITVNISAITVRNGFDPSRLDPVGGGIKNFASLTLKDAAVSENEAVSGGGIWNEGDLVLTESTISANYASSFGAGLLNSGAAELTNVTVSGNTAGAGGGILSWRMTIRNATITGNVAGRAGGLDNHAGTGGPILVLNSIVSGNSGGDCASSGVGITSNGHNLDSDGSCGFAGPGDISRTDPLLGPLVDNGGPTQTHALLEGSPAIDAGDANGCPDADQRGVPRPQGAACDIGAYEYVPPTPEEQAPVAVETTAPALEPTASPSPQSSASSTPSPVVFETEEASGRELSPMGIGILTLTVLGLGGGAAGGGYYWYRRQHRGL
jgi:hypothetical protein